MAELRVERRCTFDELSDTIMAALDVVWSMLPPERDPRQNVVRYFGDMTEPDGARIEIGVTVERAGDPVGDVHDGSLPAGRVATAIHEGAYHLLYATHQAVTPFCENDGRAITGDNWELYGDWSDDPAELRTEVFYVLADG